MINVIIQYWVEFAMGIIAAALTMGFKHLCERQKRSDKRQKAISDGVKALLRDRIIHSCNHYRNEGYCSVYALENIEEMFKEYSDLGGNGTITTIVKEMHELSREKKKE